MHTRIFTLHLDECQIEPMEIAKPLLQIIYGSSGSGFISGIQQLRCRGRTEEYIPPGGKTECSFNLLWKVGISGMRTCEKGAECAPFGELN
jgi:hypothetical protein